MASYELVLDATGKDWKESLCLVNDKMSNTYMWYLITTPWIISPYISRFLHLLKSMILILQGIKLK